MKGKAEGEQGSDGKKVLLPPSAIWKSIHLLSKNNLKYKEIEVF